MRNKSGMLWSEYEARRVHALSSGATLPTIEECVLFSLSVKGAATRSEIVRVVGVLTGIDRREVENNISSLLRGMETNGVLVRTGHNEWRWT